MTKAQDQYPNRVSISLRKNLSSGIFHSKWPHKEVRDEGGLAFSGVMGQLVPSAKR